MADNPGESDLLNFQSDYAMAYPVVRGSSDLNVAFNSQQDLPTPFVFDNTGHRAGPAPTGWTRLDHRSEQHGDRVRR